MAPGKKHARVSPSAIRDYSECAHRYWLLRVQKHKADPNPAFDVGRAVHVFLERYSEHIIGRGVSRDASVGKGIAGECMSNLGPDTATETSLIINGLLERRDLFPESAYDNPTFSVERRLSLDRDGCEVPWDSKKAMWRGIVDAIWSEDDGKTVVIRDWKTNRRPKSREGVVNDSQLAQYAWAVMQLDEFRDATSVSAYLYYVRYGAEVGVLWPRKAIEQTRQTIDIMSRRIASERDWAPNIGGACATCLVQKHCEAFKGALVREDPFDVISQDSAEEAARLYAAMGTARNVLGGKLRSWIDERGGLPVGDDKVLDVWVSERSELTDVAGVVAVLDEKYGVDRDALWSSLKLSKRDVTTLLKRTGIASKKAKKITEELFDEFGIRRMRPVMEVKKI